MSKDRIPGYCRQKEKHQSDRAYTRIRGKKIWLGIYGSPESRAKYSEILAEYVDPAAAPKKHDPTISELLFRFLKWASGYYDSREHGNFMSVARILRHHSGSILAKDFGPRRLKEVRQAMIDKGWTRKSINRQVVRIRQIINWAVGEEILPAINLTALQAVRGLREGRSDAKEKPPIQSVDDSVIDATIDCLSEMVADMVRIHRLIGCRPGELVGMRPDEIDRSRPIWVFSPADHKNRWRGQSRRIAIGPRAQEILKRYLFGEWCFVSKEDNGRPCRYLVSSYGRAIERACCRAGVPKWTPGQLRHNTATRIRAEYGLDSAQSVLGHSCAQTTELYAQLDLAKAEKIMEKIG